MKRVPLKKPGGGLRGIGELPFLITFDKSGRWKHMESIRLQNKQ